jgi:hypothetical protein
MSSSITRLKREESIGEGNSSLHHTTQRLLKFKTKPFDDSEKFNKLLEISLSDPGDKSYKIAVNQAYNNLYHHHDRFTKEESLINRMERKSQLRNTFFRGITTLTIGFSIMLVYWVASILGIAMPLLRVPL